MASKIAGELRKQLKQGYKTAVKLAKTTGGTAYLAGARIVQEKLGESGDLDTVTLQDGTKRVAIPHSYRTTEMVKDKETKQIVTVEKFTDVVVTSEERDGRCSLSLVLGNETHDLAKVAA